jgi:hypothetical protein
VQPRSGCGFWQIILPFRVRLADSKLERMVLILNEIEEGGHGEWYLGFRNMEWQWDKAKGR